MIAVDWGSSSLRAFRIGDDGDVLETRRSGQGVLKAHGNFATVLSGMIAGWDDALVVMAGMIGSRQGWLEVDYVACPAGVAQIAAGMQPLPADALPGREVWVVPGLSVFDAWQVPDVMRGEESQVCGLLPLLAAGTHFACLPGTHSKHVRVADGRIIDFSTLMTGEMFEVLRAHSVLGRLMELGLPDDAAFAEGLAMAERPGGLLRQLFTVRSRGLFDQIPPARLAGYLSGILVGHELQCIPADAGHVHVVSSDGLAGPYLHALRARGFTASHHGEEASARGMHALARARGLTG